jgi:hypothetical protein
MTSFSLANRRITTIHSMMVAASVAAGLCWSNATAAQSEQPAAKSPPAAAASAPTAAQLAQWGKSMAQVPTPKNGCFTAQYPRTEWVEVPCTTAPAKPYRPARGAQPYAGGKGTDYSAQVTSGLIASASGSFYSITDVTSETETAQGPTGPETLTDTFSLQINTNYFKTPACAGTSYPKGCVGWQQFVYSNSGLILVQYWLDSYGTTCPTGWHGFGVDGIDCFRNGAMAARVPHQPISNLKNMVLHASANAGGSDTISIDVGNGIIVAATNPGSTLDLANGWTIAEFNVFGDCCNFQAAFNAGATITIETDVDNGPTTKPPSCLEMGFTGETNNLTVVPPCCPIGRGILFTQSNAAGAKSMCACPLRATWNPSTRSCACPIEGEVIVNGGCQCPPNTFAHGGRCECAEPTAGGKCS